MVIEAPKPPPYADFLSKAPPQLPLQTLRAPGNYQLQNHWLSQYSHRLENWNQRTLSKSRILLESYEFVSVHQKVTKLLFFLKLSTKLILTLIGFRMRGIITRKVTAQTSVLVAAACGPFSSWILRTSRHVSPHACSWKKLCPISFTLGAPGWKALGTCPRPKTQDPDGPREMFWLLTMASDSKKEGGL